MWTSPVATAARWDDDRDIPEELVGRLYHASENAVLDLISRFTPTERANLAVYCYRKAHLYRIGLAIAATCDREILVQALGTNLGETLCAQSRDRALQLRESTPNAFRPKITLAKTTAYQSAEE
jgi:hypothetical protein